MGFSGSGGDAEKALEAKTRLAALPRLSQTTWKQMLVKHGWLFGSMTAKIKVIGFLTPNASASAKNVLFGAPVHDGDIVCKTIMLPDDSSPTWNLAAKLRIAYAIDAPNKYKTPRIVLNKAKQISEPKAGEFEQEWASLPESLRKQAAEEFESDRDLGKQFKIDTFYAVLPNEEIVEVGHPLNVDKVWTDYLVSKAAG